MMSSSRKGQTAKDRFQLPEYFNFRNQVRRAPPAEKYHSQKGDWNKQFESSFSIKIARRKSRTSGLSSKLERCHAWMKSALWVHEEGRQADICITLERERRIGMRLKRLPTLMNTRHASKSTQACCQCQVTHE